MYILDGVPPKAAWISLELGKFKDQVRLFADVEDDKVDVMMHQCSDLNRDNAVYVWQPRKHQFPMMPPACPRCRYRIDYRLK